MKVMTLEEFRIFFNPREGYLSFQTVILMKSIQACIYYLTIYDKSKCILVIVWVQLVMHEL